MYLLITMTLSFDLHLNSRIFLKYLVPVSLRNVLKLFKDVSKLTKSREAPIKLIHLEPVKV